MTRTPIFDALAEELQVIWQSSGEVSDAAGGRSDAGDEEGPLSGHLE